MKMEPYEIVLYKIKTDELVVYDGPYPYPCVLIDEDGSVFEKSEDSGVLVRSDEVCYIGDL